MLYKFSNSYLKSKEGIDTLVLREKDCYSTGYAYGRLISKTERKFIKLFKNPLINLLGSLLYLLNRKNFKKLNIPQDYVNELQGYSDATGIKYPSLFTANFIFDILNKYGFHCSTFSFFNNSGRVLVGRNTDCLPWLSKLILKYSRPLIITVCLPGKNKFTHFSIPFLIGAINGYNEKGIIINSHQIRYAKEMEGDSFYPTTLIMRIMLESAGNIQEAKNIINKDIISRALNILITSTKEKKSALFELDSKKECATIFRSNYACCTTHYQSRCMRKYQHEKGNGSRKRLESMKNFLENKKQLDVKDALTLLGDMSNGAKYLESGYSLSNEGTYQSFVLDPVKKRIYISNGAKAPVSYSGKYVAVKTII